MTPLWALLPGIQASGTRCAAVLWMANGRTVLGVKGTLRRGPMPTPPRRSAEPKFATGGSAGNQRQHGFFVLQRDENRWR
jgi:hypothetical protein